MPQYFDADPAVASDPVTVTLTLPDLTTDLTSDRGVFSGSRVDPGTRLLLLEDLEPPVPGDVLDLGCGYGPIAVALAHRFPDRTIWAVDVNRRALQLTAANTARYANVQVVAPDGVPDDVQLAAIWSNPPIRIGKPQLHALLQRWLRRLQPGGRAYLVVQRHLGADSLARWLTDQGHPTSRVRARAGYRVLMVETT